MMIRALTAVLLCTVCWSATMGSFTSNQDTDRHDEVNLRVKGVGLGSSYASVLRQLGQPTSSKREDSKDDTCGPPVSLLRLRYEGVLIELRADPGRENFEVVSIEITSAKMDIAPGVRIGMREKDARSKLGKPWGVRNESGFQILNYSTKGNDGGAILSFRDDQLVKIQWQYTLC